MGHEYGKFTQFNKSSAESETENEEEHAEESNEGKSGIPNAK